MLFSLALCIMHARADPCLLLRLRACGIHASRASLALFACTKLADSRYYLNDDMSIRCFVPGSEWISLVPLAIFAILCYVLAIPAVVAVTLMKFRRRLFTDALVVQAYGPLYKLFRHPFFFYPLVVLGKKLCLALCSLFLSRLPSFQLAGMQCVILIFGSLGSKYLPYYYPLYNVLDQVMTVLLFVLLLGGVLSFASVDVNGTPSDSSFITAWVIIAVVAIVLVSLYFLVADFREVAVERAQSHDPAVRDNLASAHAMHQLRTASMRGLRDIDRPAVFLQDLLGEQFTSSAGSTHATTASTTQTATAATRDEAASESSTDVPSRSRDSPLLPFLLLLP